jgi:hypothetical protein
MIKKVEMDFDGRILCLETGRVSNPVLLCPEHL